MASSKRVSRLMNIGAYEVKDDFEEKLDFGFQLVERKIKGLSETDAHQALLTLLSEDSKKYEAVCNGLLYGILIRPVESQQYFRLMSLINNDNWFCILCSVNFILIELFPKLQDIVKKQLLWLFRESIRSNVPKIDNVLLNLLRNISNGGDFGPTMYLALNILNVLNENRAWLKALKKSALVPVALMVFIRLINDHHQQPSFEQLRLKEIQLCEWLLLEKFDECLLLGRELMFLLIRVGKLPEFERVWRKIIHEPTSLSAHFQGVEDLLNRPVSLSLLQFRISVTIYRKLDFLINKAKLGQHERHLDWLAKQHLSGLDATSLRVEMIRVILNAIEVQPAVATAETSVGKWRLLLWLLPPTGLAPADSQICKLALFFDWLAYVPVSVPVGAIEPTYSLMINCLKTSPTLPITMMEFLAMMVNEFYPPLQSRIRTNVKATLQSLLDHNVSMSHSPLLESPRIDKNLSALLRSHFPEFFRATVKSVPAPASTELQAKSTAPVPVALPPTPSHQLPVVITVTDDDDETMPTGNFSDDDDEDAGEQLTIDLKPIFKATGNRTARREKKQASPPPTSEGDESRTSDLTSSFRSTPKSSLLADKNQAEPEKAPTAEVIDRLLNSVYDRFNDPLAALHLRNQEQLQQSNVEQRDFQEANEAMQRLIKTVFDYDDEAADGFGEEEAAPVADCLCAILHDGLRTPRIAFPDDDDDGRPRSSGDSYDASIDHDISSLTVEEALSTPFFFLIKTMCETDRESRSKLVMVVAEMSLKCPKVGYLLLYCLRTKQKVQNEDEADVYRCFCDALGKEVEEQITQDLNYCQDDNVKLFGYLIPFVFQKFPGELQCSSQLIHLVVQVIDGHQLNELVGDIIRDSFKMMRKDQFNSLIIDSLEWETIEQYFFWQLATAHDAPVDWFLSAIPRLKYPDHAEALSSLQLLLLQGYCNEPSSKLIRPLLMRDSSSHRRDLFTVNIFKVLITENHEKVADIVAKEITNLMKSAGDSKTSKRQQKSLTLERVFGHLDRLRQNCLGKPTDFVQQFFRQEPIQFAFGQVKRIPQLRQTFNELFAVMEILCEVRGGSEHRSLRSAGRTAGGKSKHQQDSSDDEPRVKRKTQRTQIDDSDSD